MATESVAAGAVAAEEEGFRAQFYNLLARLLAAPPDRRFLTSLSQLQGDTSPLGQALRALAKAAALTSASEAEREFNRLFIGLTAGELRPYGSYYLTGFLYEKPLADLRWDLQCLSITRSADVAEPEDHIASLCEIMAGLITAAFGRAATLGEQRRFFEAHLAPWADAFFSDLEQAASARLYRPVGSIGRLFVAIEEEAFAMAG